MLRYALTIAMVLVAVSCPKLDAQVSDEVFEKINTIAIGAFPKGTTTYELFYLPSDSGKQEVALIQAVLKAAKTQGARWVLAAESESVLKSILSEVFSNAESSRKAQTEIVIVSPIESDEELLQAARKVGAKLEFLVLKNEFK